VFPCSLAIGPTSELADAGENAPGQLPSQAPQLGIIIILLGIFDLNMPLIYGEGSKAFLRLQKKIVKRNNDLTIFAWESAEPYPSDAALNLFASSPREFGYSSEIRGYENKFVDFSVTNLGLLISGDLDLKSVTLTSRSDSSLSAMRYLLLLGLEGDIGGGILLRWIGPKLVCRDGHLPLARFESSRTATSQIRICESDCHDVPSCYLQINGSEGFSESYFDYRRDALHVPVQEDFILQNIAPSNLWDVSDRLFLKQRPYLKYPMVLALAFSGAITRKSVQLEVFCDYTGRIPTCKLIRAGSDNELPALEGLIWTEKNRSRSIDWVDIWSICKQGANRIEVETGGSLFQVVATFEEGTVEHDSSEIPLYSLRLTVTRMGD
jgi:hypothetical protein